MTWVIQSATEGPVIINDIGITLTKGQIRDLDLIGRENAERSGDVKYLLMKGLVREIRKDPPPVAASSQALEAVNEQLGQVTAITAQQKVLIENLEKQNSQLAGQLQEQKTNAEAVLSKTQKILEEVQAFAQRDPLNAKAIKEALENIMGEKGEIAARKAELEKQASEMSQKELETQNRILDMKEKRLEKNAKEMGKTVSKSAESVQESLDALDELGIN